MTEKRVLTPKEVEDLVIGIAKPTFEYFMHLVKKKSRKLDQNGQTNLNMISLLISSLGSIQSNVLYFIQDGLAKDGATEEEGILIMEDILHKMRQSIMPKPVDKSKH